MYDKESGQVWVTSLSQCVPKILTLHGMSKIDFQPEFWNSQMLSFPKMYNTMGSKVDGLAEGYGSGMRVWSMSPFF